METAYFHNLSIVDEPTGVVSAELLIDFPNSTHHMPSVYSATGSAKTSGGDEFDAALGEQLAMARAMEDVALQIQRKVNREIHRRAKVKRRGIIMQNLSLAIRRERSAQIHAEHVLLETLFADVKEERKNLPA